MRAEVGIDLVPSWNRRGGRAIKKTLERRGRGGQSRMTTPSALSKEASQYFFMRSHPSYPRRGLSVWFVLTDQLMRKASCARASYRLLLLALICVQPAIAQTWNYVGPYSVPSRILTVASDPRSDSTIYVVAAGGGIWKTQNGGSLW